jgi:hypothetical protein
MSYAFKTKRDEVLWQFVNPELQTRISLLGDWAWDRWKKLIVVTDTVRTLEEQRALNKAILAKDPTYRTSYPSVHNFGNGVDVSTFDSDGIRFTETQISEMKEWFNSQFPYSQDEQIKIQSAVYHVGTAAHLHLQINIREYGLGINPNNDKHNKQLILAIKKISGQGQA